MVKIFFFLAYIYLAVKCIAAKYYPTFLTNHTLMEKLFIQLFHDV